MATEAGLIKEDQHKAVIYESILLLTELSMVSEGTKRQHVLDKVNVIHDYYDNHFFEWFFKRRDLSLKNLFIWNYNCRNCECNLSVSTGHCATKVYISVTYDL